MSEKITNKNPELDCPRCNKKVSTIRKLWCYLCSECRIIIEYVSDGPVKIPVDIVEDK